MRERRTAISTPSADLEAEADVDRPLKWSIGQELEKCIPGPPEGAYPQMVSRIELRVGTEQMGRKTVNRQDTGLSTSGPIL